MSQVRTIEQYTGLKDKNSVEIYEGDIVKNDWKGGNEIGEIAYLYTEYVLKFHSFIDSLTALTRNKWKVEVIGNIHDNPELLSREGDE